MRKLYVVVVVWPMTRYIWFYPYKCPLSGKPLVLNFMKNKVGIYFCQVWEGFDSRNASSILIKGNNSPPKSEFNLDLFSTLGKKQAFCVVTARDEVWVASRRRIPALNTSDKVLCRKSYCSAHDKVLIF